ncbi:MAG: 1-(5-phosphoribosyl)-5-((5-phosphoribosylamino)methylideneamino)imidazole-4-carboxamide isomerase [Stygiobacter sp. RIFOXYC12_FULL_38_8]|nr:MAG: 1-(5-phosphoribosyl)-5-((5-phosphoribosylamino)methylideneamino)imidazole-4-carboxamide isomerase [Stygiobacter sp. GWC2_38_9]OGU80758.1 MAG: 1-(5-phosphoribosyl)-5-((5-phosphoribosylamino)methylideneamino)imidazole-4-carboxamide isomerase [Stygiobacter sp. RIFOXYA12_FULL_38_9]OGV09448.1 MAG: 1-(5-phosphoribosyl)-5-((5-phosphoribosylamino)methylideneamino)imidazole-4-carboxamide isomerase [Stygiobacter sp. RIFOXYB2_FULL_37_11]OGV11333.1 MAG: 1-(5-phosphoribosyl)-5-((5-phosphoribosylamino
MPKILVIPSIDIQDQKTVRAVQGIPELGCAEYKSDPIEMAMIWRAENAKCLHVVDFNAAHDHTRVNFEVIKNICESVIIPVELGGGIRNYDDAVEAFELGVARVVIGSMAFENPREFIKILDKFTPNRVVSAIDVVNGEVVTRGRQTRTHMQAIQYAKFLKSCGATRIVVTDVTTNGMLSGPNIELSRQVAEAAETKVTHSGGIGGSEDLLKLQREASSFVDSVIIGRALYENRFPCQKIWRVAEAGIFA